MRPSWRSHTHFQEGFTCTLISYLAVKAISSLYLYLPLIPSLAFALTLIGYREDVVEKWASTNPGILSRFPWEVIFEDFSEKELHTIFTNLVRSNGWHIENSRLSLSPAEAAAGAATDVDLALVVARRLVRAAGRVGFANARSVRIIFESMQRSASKRQNAERMSTEGRTRALPLNHSTTLTIMDLMGPRMDPGDSSRVKELMAMTGLLDVKESIIGLVKMSATNYDSELRGEALLDVSLHRMFLGNPGTGKTTIAKLYGKILVDLGYLSNGEVIVVGASKLKGDVVGATGTIVNKLIDSVKGKVLVIDEAYILGQSTDIYGKEALDTLVERVQGSPGEDFAVIMCGYEEEMTRMLNECNPGLKRRFQSENAFKFADYTDQELAKIMVEVAPKMQILVSPELAESCVRNVLAKQRAKPHFGNVGSINNLLNTAKAKMVQR